MNLDEIRAAARQRMDAIFGAHALSTPYLEGLTGFIVGAEWMAAQMDADQEPDPEGPDPADERGGFRTESLSEIAHFNAGRPR